MAEKNAGAEIPVDGTILERFRKYFSDEGSSPDAAVNFLGAMDEELAAMQSGQMMITPDLKEEITEFYEYFSAHYGDDGAIMDRIEGKWPAKPPAILILGYRYAVEKEEIDLAGRYDRIRRESREDYNIGVLADFISEEPCRVNIIGRGDASYQFDWPMKVVSKELTARQILKGMLSDFILIGDGMIVRRYAQDDNEKDEVYGFIPDSGSVRCMDTASLEFAMGRHADQTMRTYLENVKIKQADLSFR